MVKVLNLRMSERKEFANGLVTHFLTEDEIFEERRTTFTCAEAVLIREWSTDVAGEGGAIIVEFKLA